MTMTTQTTQTDQDRITDALDRINAGRHYPLTATRHEMNNGVVRWCLISEDEQHYQAAHLNLCRSDDTMADLLDVIAVLTEREAEPIAADTALGQAFPGLGDAVSMLNGLGIRS